MIFFPGASTVIVATRRRTFGSVTRQPFLLTVSLLSTTERIADPATGELLGYMTIFRDVTSDKLLASSVDMQEQASKDLSAAMDRLDSGIREIVTTKFCWQGRDEVRIEEGPGDRRDRKHPRHAGSSGAPDRGEGDNSGGELNWTCLSFCSNKGIFCQHDLRNRPRKQA